MSKPISAGRSSFDLIDQDAVFSALGLQPGMTVIDLACGVGRYALAMAPQVLPGGVVWGVDLWDDGIEALQAAAAQAGLTNIRTKVADISETTDIPEQSADLVLMSTILHDLVQVGITRGALAEAWRLLKPEGRLATLEFFKIDSDTGPPRDRRLSPEELETLVRSSGFLPVRTLAAGSHCYYAEFRKKA